MLFRKKEEERINELESELMGTNREMMEQENFKIKDMIAEKKAMESTIKDMLELFMVKYWE